MRADHKISEGTKKMAVVGGSGSRHSGEYEEEEGTENKNSIDHSETILKLM